MAALTANRDGNYSPGKIKAIKVADNVHIYKDSLVSILSATGYAQPGADTASTIFAGVAIEECDNTLVGHTAGGKTVRVRTEGEYLMNATSAQAQTALGKDALIVDDNTVQVAATTNSIKCGSVAEFVSTVLLRINITGYAKA